MKKFIYLPAAFTKAAFKKAKQFIRKHPNAAFFSLLAIFLVILFAGKALNGTEAPIEETVVPKKVDIYELSENPQIIVSAEVENSSVKDIQSTAGGFIKSLSAKEGDTVWIGKNLATISTTLNGENAATLQKQIASAQYENQKDTFDAQKEVIAKNRDLAEKMDANSDELRNITNQSLSDTHELIDLNEQILNSIPDTPENASAIAGQKAALSQLRATLRANEYQAASDKPAADLSNIQRELSLKQLEVQEKSLVLGLEISRLQLSLAAASEAAYFPTSTVSGVVEKVHVEKDSPVSPNQVLFTIRSNDKSSKITSKIPESIAKIINKNIESEIIFNDQVIKAKPTYISSAPVDGNLYEVIFSLKEEVLIRTGSFVKVSIPLNITESQSTYIPLDALHITQTDSVVYVVEAGKAREKVVSTGKIAGSFIEITSGLSKEESIILSRNVISGDEITF